MELAAILFSMFFAMNIGASGAVLQWGSPMDLKLSKRSFTPS